mmetsp:Transcript_18411/g.50787  ORF Transcript_18411/g.50787 Transcript_18411/m.50787 type:complete len:147 (-) Transcript_18411:574-1014(-)
MGGIVVREKQVEDEKNLKKHKLVVDCKSLFTKRQFAGITEIYKFLCELSEEQRNVFFDGTEVLAICNLTASKTRDVSDLAYRSLIELSKIRSCTKAFLHQQAWNVLVSSINQGSDLNREFTLQIIDNLCLLAEARESVLGTKCLST